MEICMRYYTNDELKNVVQYYNEYWQQNSENEYYPNIEKTDLNIFLDTNLNHQNPVSYNDLVSEYSLNVRDYFNDEHELISDLNTNTKSDKKYPIVILYTNIKDEPDMICLSEYESLRNHSDVLILNMMKYVFNQKILDKMSKYYKVPYKPEVYIK